MELVKMLNSLKIPDFWQLLAGSGISVGLVYLVEWLKQPSAKIELLPPLVLPDGRKFLKVNVKITKNGWYRKLFPWQNPASYARLKGYLISKEQNAEVEMASFTVKWDTRPEPWDYSTNLPRLELLPAVSEPENFLVGDECTASVVVKHQNQDWFFIYDANYYFNPEANQRNERKVILRLVFSSSSTSTKKDFIILNGNSSTDSFNLKKTDGNNSK